MKRPPITVECLVANGYGYGSLLIGLTPYTDFTWKSGSKYRCLIQDWDWTNVANQNLAFPVRGGHFVYTVKFHRTEDNFTQAELLGIREAGLMDLLRFDVLHELSTREHDGKPAKFILKAV